MPGGESNEAAITFSPRPYFSRNVFVGGHYRESAGGADPDSRSEEEPKPDKVREPRGNHKGGDDDNDNDNDDNDDDDDDDDDVADDENDGNDNGQREEKVHGQTKKQISKEDASPRGCWLVAGDAVATLYARDCD
ncbi:hypothetical protein K0M31_010044 [Melipona bicolor]|uniref:Uncharacterized protein n=1 Tax=Melipona bicolor TaxID=60889 RepID=A0AA40FM72_9HYME|nr:hypothetical protein K0M31_010044 [Melipona bicolor]